jgi:aspartate racemase
MGPLAGIELHRLIVEATPATKDQDHIQTVLFTNPAIPDRTQSLQHDDGKLFAAAAGESVAELEKMNVDVIAMACMTAHSRIQHIQSHTKTPILSGISLVHTMLTNYHQKRIALLATTGSVRSGIYAERPGVNWLIPSEPIQHHITEAIYKIKAGSLLTGNRSLSKAVQALSTEGAEVFVLGCTELGLLYADLQERGVHVLDPMRLIAQQITILHNLSRSAAQGDRVPAARKH